MDVPWFDEAQPLLGHIDVESGNLVKDMMRDCAHYEQKMKRWHGANCNKIEIKCNDHTPLRMEFV